MSSPSQSQNLPNQSLAAVFTQVSEFCYKSLHQVLRFISSLMWIPAVLRPSSTITHPQLVQTCVSTPDQSESVPGTSPPIESEKLNSDSQSARDSNAELDSGSLTYGSDANQDSSPKASEDLDKPEPASPVSPTQLEFECFLELSLLMHPEDPIPNFDPSTSNSIFKPILDKLSHDTDTGRDEYTTEQGSSPTPILQFRPANLDLNQPLFNFTFNLTPSRTSQSNSDSTPAASPQIQPAMDSDDSDSDFDPSGSESTSEPYSDNLSYESNASQDSFIPGSGSSATPVCGWRPGFGSLDLIQPLFRFTFQLPSTEPSTAILNSPPASSSQPEVKRTSAPK